LSILNVFTLKYSRGGDDFAVNSVLIHTGVDEKEAFEKAELWVPRRGRSKSSASFIGKNASKQLGLNSRTN
jgi:hypothetical protein